MVSKLKEILKNLGLEEIKVTRDKVPFTENIGIIFKEEEHLIPLIDILEKSTKTESLYLKSKKGKILIKYSEVILIEKVDKKTYFYTDKGEGYTHKTLEYYERELYIRKFIRINKSQIVNFNKIVRIVPLMNRKLLLELDDESALEVSRGYRRNFDKMF
ncbi:LytR/AlgR family response regulator transcription factor [Psychrilyobacter atlanticus]|uniref:LytR/AlgR family response regulator transcription factor n=1 Tax=Psychrilyobacter atlanticus TaxID=271091 RepID=UPI0004004A91|nr:LytTR family DNA-binding domain-containing protein [Psychrilyobacter atlanticus]